MTSTGTRVLIRTGMNGGVEGTVVNTERSLSGRTVVNVRLLTTVSIDQPDGGPMREVVLPYAPAELEVL